MRQTSRGARRKEEEDDEQQQQQQRIHSTTMLASTRAAPCATRRSFALAPATAPSAPHVRRCSAAGPRAARQRRPHVLLRPAQAAADNAQAEAPPQPQEPPPEPETVFFEGNGGSSAELAISLILGLTLVYAPLTIASIGAQSS